MQTIFKLLAVGFAIYVFILLISSIDFSGMAFKEIRLIISICVGIAVSFVSASKGVHIIHSAISGFVVGVVLFALISGLLAIL